jgi:hypothetical protein
MNVYLTIIVFHCCWEIVVRLYIFFLLSIFFLLFFFYLINRMSIEQTQRKIIMINNIVMHINAMVDTPRIDDYVCMWVVVIPSSFFSFFSINNLLFGVYTESARLIFYLYWYNTLFSFFPLDFTSSSSIFNCVAMYVYTYTQHNTHHRDDFVHKTS